MTELRKKMRRGLAGFLVFCVIFTSIPSFVWADQLPESHREVPTKEEVMASAELKLIPEDTPIPYSELTEKAQDAIRTSEPVVLEQLGQFSTGKDRQYYSELFEGDVFRTSQYGDGDTACVVVFVKPVKQMEDYSDYVITGAEKYIFLYVNKTDQDYNMKINIAGYHAKTVTVPSANTVRLLNEKKASPSNSESVNVIGTPSNSESVNVIGAAAAEEEETAEEETAAESEAVNAEETSDIEESQEITASLSRSLHKVPVVGVPVAGEVYEGEAKNPQEEYNLMRGLPADYEEEDEDEESGDEEAYEYSGVNGQENRMADYSAAVMILTGLLEKEETASPSIATQSSASRSLFRSRSQAAAVGVSEETVELLAETSGGTFDISFYDYASQGLYDSPNKEILDLPGYGSDKLFIGDRSDAAYLGDQNRWIGGLLGISPPYDDIVMQGIAKDSYDSEGRIQFNYTTGPVFGKSGAGSNPDMAGITKYENVNVAEGNSSNPFFVKDSDGNFVYDSSQRDAALVKGSDASGKTTYTLEGRRRYYTKEDSGFWPLNGYNSYYQNYDESSKNEYFGMTLSFDFIMPENGKITTPDGREKNMVFEFNGDDDVWVYLRKAGSKKGSLALDLGGIHGASGGKIDFSTGLITHDKVWTGKKNVYETRSKAVYWYLYDDKKAGEWVDGHQISKVVGLSRDVWEEYTLDFYFMERGGYNSNCKIVANMPTIPKDKIAVFKSVAGETEEDTFEMQLQTKDETGQWKTIETQNVKKNQKTEFKTELPEKTEYRVVETDTSAPVTSWKIGDETKRGLESPTGIAGRNNLAICFNNYDFAPSISKRAVEDTAEKDLYWISLGITGNSAVQQTIEGVASSEKTFYIDTVSVEDILTDWVNLELKENSPQVKLTLKRSGEADFKELPIQTEKSADGTYRIVYDSHEIAVIDGNTIKWTAVDKSLGFGDFDENSSVVLSYLVHVSDKAEYQADESKYPNQGDSDTGTHSGAGGYYSNVKATADYTTELVPDPKTLIFKKPAVRPLKPEGSLTITKEVDSKLPEAFEKEFQFTVELNNIRVKSFLAGTPGNMKRVTVDTEGIATLSFSLKDGESYKISDLNKETRYKITEGMYSDVRFYSNLTGISVTRNGVADGTGISVWDRTAEGTLASATGNKTEYYYNTASSVKGDEFYYNSEDVMSEKKGQDGWYENGTLIPEGDERFYKTEEGSIPQEEKKGTEIYRWSYGGNSVSADAGNPAAVYEAQKKVQDWLSADKYNRKPAAENTEPYSVSARKIDSWGEETYSQTWSKPHIWQSGTWEWDNNENPDEKYSGDDYEIIDVTPGNEYWEKGRLKRDVTYTYNKLSAPLVITPAKVTAPGEYFWTWNNQTYDSQDALISALTAAGWNAKKAGTAVEYYRRVKLTNSELLTKYEYRRYFERTAADSAAGNGLAVNAVFTNSFEKRESITVKKEVWIEEGREAVKETYSYRVTRYDGDHGYQLFTDYTIQPEAQTTASYDSEAGIFTITGSGSVELIMDESVKNGLYRIEETDQGTADDVKWNDSDSGYSKLLQNGEMAVCTNYYYNNTLTISKELSPDSCKAAPNDSKVFRFTVELKGKNGEPLKQVGYQNASGIGFGETVDTGSRIISLTNGRFTFMMEAGGELVLDKIPSGAQYTVTEDSFAHEQYGDYYTVNLVSTKKNDEALIVWTQMTPVSNTVSGDFGNDGSAGIIRNQRVEYINKIVPIRRDITINKFITDKKGNPLTNDGDGETFIFEITNIDEKSPGYGEKFYASVITNGGSGSMTIHDVFAGVYEVKEMNHMRFNPTDGKRVDEIDAVKQSGNAVFKNYRSSSEYFSDSKAAVNKVSENGFTRTDSKDAGRNRIKPVILPPAILKQDEYFFGEGSFDSDDMPYHG